MSCSRLMRGIDGDQGSGNATGIPAGVELYSSPEALGGGRSPGVRDPTSSLNPSEDAVPSVEGKQ